MRLNMYLNAVVLLWAADVVSAHSSSPSPPQSSPSVPSSSQVTVQDLEHSPSLLDRLGSALAPLLRGSFGGSGNEGGDDNGSGPPSGSGSSHWSWGGKASSLLWGEGSLQVVRSQAIYATRPAAFGPHVTSDEGLHGHLIPISEYWQPKHNASRPKAEPIHGCPADEAAAPSTPPHVASRDEEDFWLSMADGHPRQRPLQQVNQRFDTNQMGKNGDKSLLAPPKDWIALVSRGHCPFTSKVRLAQDLGAIAVVVGDTEPELVTTPNPPWNWEPKDGSRDDESDAVGFPRLLTMFAEGDTSDILIPSTFVTWRSYQDLQRQYDEVSSKAGLEIILSRDDAMLEWPLLNLALLLLLLPSFMTFSTVIIHRVRMIQRRRRERAPEDIVSALPTAIWRKSGLEWQNVEKAKKADATAAAASAAPTPARDDDLQAAAATAGGPGVTAPSSAANESAATSAPQPASSSQLERVYYSAEECPICLCNFEDGERVRLLPCKHLFHAQCIDPWLIQVKRYCPSCRSDIVQGSASTDAEGQTEDGTSGSAADPAAPFAVVVIPATDVEGGGQRPATDQELEARMNDAMDTDGSEQGETIPLLRNDGHREV